MKLMLDNYITLHKLINIKILLCIKTHDHHAMLISLEKTMYQNLLWFQVDKVLIFSSRLLDLLMLATLSLCIINFI